MTTGTLPHPGPQDTRASMIKVSTRTSRTKGLSTGGGSATLQRVSAVQAYDQPNMLTLGRMVTTSEIAERSKEGLRDVTSL